MTLEELKAEAKAHGYKLMPIKVDEPFLPCTCGAKRREHWSRWTGDGFKITLMCRRCGKRVSGMSEAEAKYNWNEVIRNERDNRKV